jgi:hypothetical protein
MRVLQGRGDWFPGFRIEGLRRYAFIGDSHTYGAGVAPDETFSAAAERQLNEALLGWPVEVVNLGFSGYNLWNSWLGFKQAPQVYDGVVLTLCCNDADLFGRCYHVNYPGRHQIRWESSHPIGQAVARCFDEIASFSQASSLPVAVSFFNVFDVRDKLRIGEIIGDLCASRGLPYIDTFAHFLDRKFARADLLVSSADFHPSPMAHEAMGRYIVATLRRKGWFSQYEGSAVADAPDRILAAARAMVQADHYPRDAALNWALRALEVKSRVAGRLHASGADDNFSAGAARASKLLTTANRRWHTIHRVRALLGEVGEGGHGISSGMWRAQEEKLTLDELCFALGTGDWDRLSACLPPSESPPQITPDDWPTDAPEFLDGCIHELLLFRKELPRLHSFASPAAVKSPHDKVLMRADLEALARLADRAEAECGALKEAFLRITTVFGDARPTLSEEQIAHISSLVGASFKRVKESFFFARLLATIQTIQQIGAADCAAFTNAEVTMCGQPIEGNPMCSLVGTVEYSVPDRLAFTDAGSFWSDGSPTLLKLRFPIFYAGRLILRTYNSKAPGRPMIEAAVVKVELYNGKSQRRIVEGGLFHRGRAGRFVSPLIYLP